MCRLVAGALLWFLACTSWAEPQKITMCNVHWPPFIVVQQGEKVQGSWVELLNTVFKQLPQYTLRIENVPWKRCLLLIDEGVMDGTFALVKTPERMMFMDFTTKIISDRSMIWYSTHVFPEPFNWHKYQDLSHHVTGVVRGESFNPEIDELISSKKIQVEYVTNDAQNFMKLASGRIDITVKNERVGWTLINELNLHSQVNAAVKPAYEKPRFISFSQKKNYQDLIFKMNDILKQMQARGEIRKILGYPPL